MNIFSSVELGPNQICTLFGAIPGQQIVSGRNYALVGYGLDVSDLWRRNLLVIIGFMLLFQLTQVLLIEFFPHFDAGSTITIFAPEDSDTEKRNAILRERKEGRSTKSANEKASAKDEEDGGCV